MARGYFRGYHEKGRGFADAPKRKKVKRCSYCGQFIATRDFVAHIKTHTEK